MLGSHFYHGLIRRYVILFGSLFNDIYVDRVDSTGETQKTIKIPLQYGPKERYLTRYIQNPDLLREVSMVFPRMSFEMTNVYYDASRKLNSIGKNTSTTSYTNTLGQVYNPVPYNFDFTLSIISRNTEDAVRIVEQVLPYFTPQWTESLILVPEANISMDIPIVINSTNVMDTYSGSFEDKEWVIWEMTFTLKGYLYGPVRSNAVIKDAFTNLYEVPGKPSNYVGIASPTVEIEITPGLTANGEPTSDPNQSIPASEIKADDNYGFITDFTYNLG